ncbi:MAG: hypothetical protein J6D25_05175 [Eggerthellaceae bacterium]|nr:hypothetical protein [Eggerthellaceae bacterium]
MGHKKMLVNLNRCTGCWSCSMACKSINELADEDFWVTVRTNGSGSGIDHPQGKWPNLSLSWQPIWSTKCIECAPRQAEGKLPFCVECCTNKALSYGDDAEQNIEELRAKGFELFELPAYEGTRKDVVYARKETSRFKD